MPRRKYENAHARWQAAARRKRQQMREERASAAPVPAAHTLRLVMEEHTAVQLYRTEKAAALERAKSRGGSQFVTSGRCPLTRVSGRPAA